MRNCTFLCKIWIIFFLVIALFSILQGIISMRNSTMEINSIVPLRWDSHTVALGEAWNVPMAGRRTWSVDKLTEGSCNLSLDVRHGTCLLSLYLFFLLMD